MSKLEFKDLLDAGVHFGHLKRKRNPKMTPYIFMEKNGIHIIDLHKTIVKIEEAKAAMKQIAKSGRKILFVATKKQAKDIVSEKVKEVGMPYITERWSGGMLTNFKTIRKAIKKMKTYETMVTDVDVAKKISKRERLQITREKAKLEKNLGSIADMTRMPSAVFVVDVMKEHIAVKEAQKLDIPVFGIVDTNSDPTIDFMIPANDDATKSIALIIGEVTKAVAEGLAERKAEKPEKKETKPEGEKKTRARKTRKTE